MMWILQVRMARKKGRQFYILFACYVVTRTFAVENHHFVNWIWCRKPEMEFLCSSSIQSWRETDNEVQGGFKSYLKFLKVGTKRKCVFSCGLPTLSLLFANTGVMLCKEDCLTINDRVGKICFVKDCLLLTLSYFHWTSCTKSSLWCETS